MDYENIRFDCSYQFISQYTDVCWRKFSISSCVYYIIFFYVKHFMILCKIFVSIVCVWQLPLCSVTARAACLGRPKCTRTSSSTRRTWTPWRLPTGSQLNCGETWTPWRLPTGSQLNCGETWTPWRRPTGSQLNYGETWTPWRRPTGSLLNYGETWTPRRRPIAVRYW